jgi:DNA repair protein RecO (recombination protein O)
MEEVEGIILKETPYKEHSKIIQILTKEHGLISVIAKGVKSPKSPLRALSIRFTYGLFQISYKESKLSTLINADVINPLETIKNDIELISYLGYISELTMQVVKHEYNNDIYDMFITSILKINEGMDPLIISNILELKYLPYLGVGISLNECVKCGKKTDIMTIDGDAGGLICKNCYTNEVIVDLKTIKLIRMYYLVDIKSISKINISDKVKNEINMFIDRYYDRYTGLYLKSKDFLNKIRS